MALVNFKRIARYFPAPIRKAWGEFIDELTTLDASIPPNISQFTDEPTGFIEDHGALLDFDNPTREFTIEPKSSAFTYVFLGNAISKQTPQTIQIPDTTGLHHFYFDSDGVLNTSMSVTLFELIKNNVYIANVYWDATRSVSVVRGNELHGLMPWQSHLLQHEYSGGTLYGGGLGISDVLTDQDGSLDAHVQFSVASGTIVDEDIYHGIASKGAGFIIPTLAKETSAGTWYEIANSSAPIVLSGGVPQINNWNGAAWVQTPVSNNKYFLAHIFFTNDWRSTNKVIHIQGDTEYNSIAYARAGAITEIGNLTTAGLPMAEFLASATFIVQYSSSYTNTYSSRFKSTAAGEDFVSWIGEIITPGSSPSSHANLTNRNDPHQHEDTAIDLSTVHAGLLSGELTVDEAMIVLDGMIPQAYSPSLYWQFGEFSEDMVILASEILTFPPLKNGEYFKGHESDGATVVTMLGVNGSEEVVLGDVDNDLVVKSDGQVDFEDNDIETTGDVVCDNSNANFDRVLNSTTLTDGAGFTFLKMPLALAKAGSCAVYWEVESTDGTSVEFASGNARFSAKRESGGITASTVVEWGRDNGLIGSMTVTIGSSGVAATEGRMTINANTSLSGATITLRVRALSGSEIQPVWNF